MPGAEWKGDGYDATQYERASIDKHEPVAALEGGLPVHPKRSPIVSEVTVQTLTAAQDRPPCDTPDQNPDLRTAALGTQELVPVLGRVARHEIATPLPKAEDPTLHRGDETLAKAAEKEKRITVVAQNPNDADIIVTHLIDDRITNLLGHNKGGAIISVDLDPGDEHNEPLTELYEDDPRVRVIQTEPTSPLALSLLKPDQLAEALANAVAGCNKDASPHILQDALLSVITELSKETDPTTKQVRVKPLEPGAIRDAVRTLCGKRSKTEQPDAILKGLIPSDEEDFDETPTLTPAEQRQVRLCIDKQTREQNAQQYTLLRTALDRLFPADEPQRQPSEVTKIDLTQDPEECVTLLHIGVSPETYGTRRQLEAYLANYMLPPLLAQRFGHGRPAQAAMRNLEYGDPSAVAEVKRICNKKQVPLIMAIGTVDEQNCGLITGGAHIVAQVDPATSDVLSAKVLGKERRLEVSRRGSSVTANDGTGDHTSEGVNRQILSTFPEGQNWGKSRDRTRGMAYGLSEDVTINDAAVRYTSAQLEKILAGMFAFIDSNGNAHGAYSVLSAVRLDSFPPQPIQPDSAKVARAIARVQAAELTAHPHDAAQAQHPALPAGQERSPAVPPRPSVARRQPRAAVHAELMQLDATTPPNGDLVWRINRSLKNGPALTLVNPFIRPDAAEVNDKLNVRAQEGNVSTRGAWFRQWQQARRTFEVGRALGVLPTEVKWSEWRLRYGPRLRDTVQDYQWWRSVQRSLQREQRDPYLDGLYSTLQRMQHPTVPVPPERAFPTYANLTGRQPVQPPARPRSFWRSLVAASSQPRNELTDGGDQKQPRPAAAPEHRGPFRALQGLWDTMSEHRQE